MCLLRTICRKPQNLNDKIQLHPIDKDFQRGLNLISESGLKIGLHRGLYVTIFSRCQNVGKYDKTQDPLISSATFQTA